VIRDALDGAGGRGGLAFFAGAGGGETSRGIVAAILARSRSSRRVVSRVVMGLSPPRGR